jgi:hypothetical protein
MIRKTLIAIAAAATLALGVGATTAPAEAGVKLYFGTPYYGYYGPGYYGHRYYGYRHRYNRPYVRIYNRAPYHCHRVKIRSEYGVKRVKRCHRRWH